MIFTPPPEHVRSEFNITYDIDAAWGYNNHSGVHASWPSYQYPGVSKYLLLPIKPHRKLIVFSSSMGRIQGISRC